MTTFGRNRAKYSVRTQLLIAVCLAVAPTACSSRSEPDVTRRWIATYSAVDEWGPTFKPAKAPIDFHSDGTWVASDGCAQIRGTYTIRGEAFSGRTLGLSGGVACLGGGVSYDRLIPEADRVSLRGDILELSKGQRTVLRLRAQPERPELRHPDD